MRFWLWVDPQWGPCAPAAPQKAGAVSPGILAHTEASPCLVNTGSTSTRLPSCPGHAGISRSQSAWSPGQGRGGVPAGPASLRYQPPPPPPWGAGARRASPLGSPGVMPAAGPAPPLGLCVLCLTGSALDGFHVYCHSPSSICFCRVKFTSYVSQ